MLAAMDNPALPCGLDRTLSSRRFLNAEETRAKNYLAKKPRNRLKRLD
jgi:hypothetical protein